MGIDPDELQGRVVVAVRRRGKYLLIDLATPAGGRTGCCWCIWACRVRSILRHRWARWASTTISAWHTRAACLRLNDPRRFGAVVYASSEHDSGGRKLLGGLGVEPLSDDFDGQGISRSIATAQNSHQTSAAGGRHRGGGGQYLLLGGACFWRVSGPRYGLATSVRPAPPQLHAAIRDVLQAAVNKGGSTLRDFSNAEGKTGYFQLQAMVYGRAGEPCRVCAAAHQADAPGPAQHVFLCYLPKILSKAGCRAATCSAALRCTLGLRSVILKAYASPSRQHHRPLI